TKNSPAARAYAFAEIPTWVSNACLAKPMLARSRKEITYISNRKGTSRLRVREIARSHKLSEIPNREADWLRIEWISCNSIPFCNKKPASDSLLRPREPD